MVRGNLNQSINSCGLIGSRIRTFDWYNNSTCLIILLCPVTPVYCPLSSKYFWKSSILYIKGYILQVNRKCPIGTRFFDFSAPPILPTDRHFAHYKLFTYKFVSYTCIANNNYHLVHLHKQTV